MTTPLMPEVRTAFGLNQETLCALPKAARDELWLWDRHAAALRVESGVIGVCKELAPVLQVSWRVVYRRWHDYEATGDALCLINRTRLPRRYWNTSYRQLPPAFPEWVNQVWSMHQRDKFASARAAILRQWRRWLAGDADARIPGYDAPPPADPSTGYPTGWSETNLRRAARASQYARTMIQVGPKAAAVLAPPVLATRQGLRVGQYYLFDDSWNDFKVVARGQCVRLLSFHALDLASGCNVMRGHKPALTDERGVEVRLKEREMVFLVVALLTQVGYRPTGTELVCEKGTATVREREANLLEQLTHGKVVVRTGPSGGGPGIAGLFTGPGGGNPRWKAPLESWFNLLRNCTASMLEFPAQTGSNSRLNQPEGLARMERDTLAMVRAAAGLPEERLEMMRLGLLPYTEAQLQLDEIVEQINRRTDHDLEGWRRCGHYVQEWRPMSGMPWQPMASLLSLPEPQRSSVAALVAGNPELTRERALSPREVFDTGAAGLVKLAPVAAAMLLGDVEGVERSVRNGLLELPVPEVDPDEPLRFGPLVKDCRGSQVPLRDGEKYLVRVNPLDPSVGWLYDARGGWVGMAPHWGRVRREDPESLQRQWASRNQWKAAHLEEARRLAAPLTRAAAEIAEAQREAILGARPRESRRVVMPGEQRQAEVEKFLALGGTVETAVEEPAVDGQLAALEALGGSQQEEGEHE